MLIINLYSNYAHVHVYIPRREDMYSLCFNYMYYIFFIDLYMHKINLLYIQFQLAYKRPDRYSEPLIHVYILIKLYIFIRENDSIIINIKLI